MSAQALAYRAAFDALPDSVALVAPDGEIIGVNECWKRFGVENDFPDDAAGVGQNYLEVCDRAARLGDRLARLAANGLRAVIAGANAEFQLEYPCHSPAVQRWFVLRAVPFETPAGRGAVVVHRNVTERRKAEQGRRRLEERYQRLVEDLPLIVYRVSPEPPFTPLYVSEAVETLGYSVAEWMEKPDMWLNILHPDDRERIIAATTAGLSRRAAVEYEYRVIDRAGAERWIHDRGSLVYDETCEALVWQGVMMDVTNRRSAERTLHENEERFRLAARATNDVLWDWDPQRGVVWWGEARGTVFGYTDVDESTATTWWIERIHADDRDRVSQSRDDALTKRESDWTAEYRFQRADGTYAVVLDRGYVVYDEQRRPRRMIGAMLDITARVESEARLRAQFRNLPVPTQLWQLVDGAFVLSDFNEAARQLQGTQFEAGNGTLLDSLYPLVPPISEDMRRCLAEQSVIHRDVEHRAGSTGDTRTLSLTMGPLPPDRVLVHAVDVTDRLMLEAQLRQAQKMEAVGQLAGGIAHDFNNLLTVIQSCSDFLAEQLDESNPLFGDVTEIRRATGRAASLTRQLLAYSRKQVLKPRMIDLNHIAAGIEPMLRRLIGEDIRMMIKVEPTLGTVQADPGQIEQVLVNLALNARDAMPRGGTLTISTANVQQARGAVDPAMAAGRYVRLTVTDTGMGMSPAAKRHLFEPFFTTKPTGQGTGLGLPTVYGIVKQSGGFISVDSEEGKGTSFAIFLPVVESKHPMRDTPTSVPAITRGSGVILLVEDEDSVRALARRILERRGFQVVEASHGREALDIAQKMPRIDLLVTDMVMPEMGGTRLYEELRSVRGPIPVLYMSGYTDDDIVRRGLYEPGQAFLQKPFTAIDLSCAVTDVLRGAAGEAPICGAEKVRSQRVAEALSR